jgi:hypothetical protein
MSGVAVTAIITGAQWATEAALVATWGGSEQLARVFGALHECLADDSLTPLPAEVRALVEDVTWAQVADGLRIAKSSQWAHGLTVSTSAMWHQMLWLLLGGDCPSPRQLQGGYHKALQRTLSVQIATRFDAEADVEAKGAKTRGGKGAKYNVRAARAAVALRLPWSAPADVLLLRALMVDPAGATAKLGAALRAAGPPCALLTLPPTQSCTPPARPMSSRAVQYCVTGRRGSTPPQPPPSSALPTPALSPVTPAC